MLEFLASKVAMMMAMVVMVSVISSVFTIEKDAFRGGELQHAADDIAGAIEAMTMRGAEGTSMISFSDGEEGGSGQGGGGRSVPMAVAGGTYSISISRVQVVVSQRGMTRAADFRGTVHIFDPNAIGDHGALTLAEMDGLDDAAGPLVLTSGQDLALRNTPVKLDGNDVMLTFIGVMP